MSYLFYNYNSLISLPDISRWNTSNVENMSYIFYKCYSLISLPDISKWERDNYKIFNIYYDFYNCISLISLPNISGRNSGYFDDLYEPLEVLDDCINSINAHLKF